jgi:NDP-sugar pyrophosphorylase family protein
MVMAAGVGSRLRPLTDRKPKALIEIGGVPMLEAVISRLKRAAASPPTIALAMSPFIGYNKRI